MTSTIIFGVLFLLVGLFLTFMPATATRLERTKQKAVLGHNNDATKYRPRLQRLVGVVPIIAGIVIIIVGALK